MSPIKYSASRNEHFTESKVIGEKVA